MTGWKLLSLTLIATLGFAFVGGNASAEDVADTTWDITLDARNWVWSLGSNGGWWDPNETDYTLEFTTDEFTLTDADDNVVLSGTYTQDDGFWNNVELEPDETELLDFITAQVEGLAGDDDDLVIDEITLDDGNWSWITCTQLFDSLRLSFYFSQGYTVVGTLNDEDLDEWGKTSLSGSATQETDPITWAETTWDLDTKTIVGTWDWDYDDVDGWSFSRLFDTVVEEGTMTIILGPNDDEDVAEGEYLATDGDGNELSGTWTEWYWWGWSALASINLDINEDDFATRVADAVDAAIEDLDEDVTDVTTTVDWQWDRTSIFFDKMRIGWSAWGEVTATVDGEEGTWNVFFKIYGSGEQPSDMDTGVTSIP